MTDDALLTAESAGTTDDALLTAESAGTTAHARHRTEVGV
jgi:hypothetical protein